MRKKISIIFVHLSRACNNLWTRGFLDGSFRPFQEAARNGEREGLAPRLVCVLLKF